MISAVSGRPASSKFPRRRVLSLGLLALLAPALAGADPLAAVHRERYAMGTMFNVVIYHDEVAAAGRAAEAALDEVVRLDAVMSHYKADSELSRVNREARRGFVAVEPGLYEVLERSLAVSRASDGRFDVTVAPVIRAWKQALEQGREPSAEEIERARRCVGYRHLELRPPHEVRFGLDCLELDLGGIGKGFAVDRAMAIIEAAGIRHAVVNAGGSTIAAVGAPPGLEGWPVALEAPAGGRRTLLLRGEAVSTSRQQLRSLPFGRGAFGEIVEPGAAAPTSRDETITVVARDATSADALSTALLLMPAGEGRQLLGRFAALAGLWIAPGGELRGAYHAESLRLAELH